MSNQIKPSDSIDAKHHRAWDPSRICRGYTVFRFRCNGFKDPAVYHREPLSFLSEHSLVALGSNQSTDLVRAHVHTYPQSLFHTCNCITTVAIAVLAFVPFFVAYTKLCCFWGIVVEGARGNLKSPGRFKALVVFPTVAFANDLNNIVCSPFLLVCLALYAFLASAFELLARPVCLFAFDIVANCLYGTLIIHRVSPRLRKGARYQSFSIVCHEPPAVVRSVI